MNRSFRSFRLVSCILLAIFLQIGCGPAQSQQFKFPLGQKGGKAPHEAVAYFAEGCFWHTELVFQSLAGVRDAVSGYSGGSDSHPTYERVSTGSTGHAESVEVFYDPSKISYATLVDAFFASMDPTELNRQGPDEGTQYRSMAFYQNDQEKKIIEDEIARLTAEKKYRHKIVTEVVPFAAFYPAEDYHQEYIYYHPDNPYVQNVSIPDFLRFRNSFKGAAFKGGI
jgi:peptide-methionine (S)-S-oxide reductase